MRFPLTRRHFLGTVTASGAGLLLGGSTLLQGCAPPSTHPSILVTAEKIAGLRARDEVLAATRTGHSHTLWNQMLAKAREDLDAEPLTPSSIFPGRNLTAAKYNNADYTICFAAGQRVLRNALVHLITPEPGYKATALRQMEALFDPGRWPQWMDQAHERFGHAADLRTGMLSQDVGLAYDWLYPSLSESERSFILEGLDRCGIQPYLQSLAQDPWWVHDLNNWLTVIVGGLGVAGMALGNDHPDSTHLIEYALPKMEAYMASYGPNGEFNESPGYSSATRLPVGFYLAHLYWSRGGENILAQTPFPETCEWVMYNTLPSGMASAFGDTHTDHPMEINYFPAVASATRNGILQWQYLNYARPTANPMEFLYFDDSVEPVSPAGTMPLGKAFPAHGMTISSRTSWAPQSDAVVVYGKAGREENHENNDVGQLCIDAFRERLITDPGSPSGYPADFFEPERWNYYNAGTIGHNVLQFGDREMRVTSQARSTKDEIDFATYSGKIITSDFDDQRGSSWRLDLTNAYTGVTSVHRTVIHLFPGAVIVLDEAKLEQPEKISLRWHTPAPVTANPSGQFRFMGERAQLTGRILSLTEAPLTLHTRQHAYAPPFDKDRAGEPLEQRHEPYLEALLQSDTCRILTLFAIAEAGTPLISWKTTPAGWQIDTPQGQITIALTETQLEAQNSARDTRVRVGLQEG